MATKKKPAKKDDAAPETEAVEVEKIETNPVEATEPYPTGSPPDPREEYFKIHGRYPAEPEES